MSEERKSHMTSVLGETAIVIGNVTGQGDLEVRGRVQGSVELIGRLLIAETGVVLGNIEATTVTIAGELRGDASSSDGLFVQSTGQVEGILTAARVGIEPGARVRGTLRSGEPAPTAPPAPSTSEESEGPVEPEVDEAPVEDTRARPAQAASAAVEEAAVEEAAVEEAAVEEAAVKAALVEAPKKEEAPAIEEKPARPRKRRRPKKPASNQEIQTTASPAAAERPTTETSAPKTSPAKARSPRAAPPAEAELSNTAEPKKTPTRVKKPRSKGPPTPPTFVKGTKGHTRG